MKKQPIRVAITGAAGQIGYALAFRVAAGELFGLDQPVCLHLIELEDRLKALEGLVMELEDCAFPLLSGCVVTSELRVGFGGIHWALLVGSVPRKAGMERKDLLSINAQIFIEQGRALQAYAAPEVQVLVVGNPCNTNAWIAHSVAPDIPQKAWLAMTRLDENRARAQLAAKARVNVSEVTRMAVWGNHSATQYPDFHQAWIAGRPARELIQDDSWLEGDFLKNVQTRGAAVIAARGASSAASAAHAIIETVQSVTQDTLDKDWHSVAVVSSGEYGVPAGLVCSFPVRCKGGTWEVVEGLELSSFSQKQVQRSVDELLEEQEAVRHLLRF